MLEFKRSKRKIQHPTMKGFYKIENSGCWVNKFGKIWSEKKKKFIIEDASNYKSSDKDYYPQRVLDDGSVRPIHRVVAELFVKKPVTEKPLQINHIDGNKKNYSADNLEWVTASRNIQHAFENGLTSSNIPVLVKDLETGIVHRFYSISECSKYLRVDFRRILYYMEKPRTLPFRKKWDIVKEGNSWNPIPKYNIGKEHRNADKAVVGVKRADKSIVIFANIARASDFTGINGRIIQRRLYRDIHPRTHSCGPKVPELDWVFFYHKNNQETENRIKDILKEPIRLSDFKIIETRRMNNLKNYKPALPVEVIVEETGEKTMYKSLRLFCEEKSFNYHQVKTSVRIKQYYKGYKIRYLK